MEGPTIIIFGGSSSEELIERGLKFVLTLFFVKITFKLFIIFINLIFLYFFYLFFHFFKLFKKLFLTV